MEQRAGLQGSVTEGKFFTRGRTAPPERASEKEHGKTKRTTRDQPLKGGKNQPILTASVLLRGASEELATGRSKNAYGDAAG